MILKKQYITVLLTLLAITKSYSQGNDWVTVSKENMSKVFEGMNSWFRNTTDYSLTVTHASYKDYKTTVPAEKSVGYFKKDKNNNYHSFLLGIHTIQNAGCKIVVDSMQKIIMVANPDKLIWTNYTNEDYTYILNAAVSIKMMNYTNEKLYRVEFSKSATISSYEFLIGSDNVLKQIVWYYGKEVKSVDDESTTGTKPRLVITFSNMKKNAVLNYKDDFDESNYFTKNNSKMILTERYKKYKLIDSRVELPK
jgi:hypothetical protein